MLRLPLARSSPLDHLLEFMFQGGSLKFGHVIKKKLMHPKRGDRWTISPMQSRPIEKEDIPCHAMSAFPLSQL